MNQQPSHNSGPLPDELMDQFHKANDRFHEARMNLEAQMAGIDHRHNQRVEQAADAVHAAELEVEEITDKISKELHADSPGPQPESPNAGPVADFEPLR